MINSSCCVLCVSFFLFFLSFCICALIFRGLFWQTLLKALWRKHWTWFNNVSNHLKICRFYTRLLFQINKSIFMKAVKTCNGCNKIHRNQSILHTSHFSGRLLKLLNVCITSQMFILLIHCFSMILFARFYILLVFSYSVSFFPVETHFFTAAMTEFPHRDQ